MNRMTTRNGTTHWLLKLAVVLSYCFIMIPGEHVGGPLLVFVLFGLGEGGAITLVCALVILTLLAILTSMLIWDGRFNRALFPTGLMILSVPVIYYTPQIIEHSWFGVPFISTVALFAVLMTATIYFTFRRKSRVENEGTALNT